MSIQIEDKVILVTGAGRGLGLAYSKCLIDHGACVAMQDGGVDPLGKSPNDAFITDVVRDLGLENAFAVPGLLDTKDQCLKAVERTVQRFGRIDGLIHNAGFVDWTHTLDVEENALRASSAVNHEAALWLVQAALPHMIETGMGRIVLTTSGWALGPYPGSERLTLYCQSKGAQLGFGMALANGTGHPNIKVNVVAPIANTRIYASEVAPGTLKPEDVAGTVAWLASPACSVNGRLFKVADGKIMMLEMQEVDAADLAEAAQDPSACGAAIEAFR